MKIKSKKIGLFYGSDTGVTEYVTELILKRIDKVVQVNTSISVRLDR